MFNACHAQCAVLVVTAVTFGAVRAATTSPSPSSSFSPSAPLVSTVTAVDITVTQIRCHCLLPPSSLLSSTPQLPLDAIHWLSLSTCVTAVSTEDQSAAPLSISLPSIVPLPHLPCHTDSCKQVPVRSCYSNHTWVKLLDLPPREVGRCKWMLGEALGCHLWVGKETAPILQNSRAIPRVHSNS